MAAAACDRGWRQHDQTGGSTMRRSKRHPARTAWFVVAGLVAFMLVLAGCGGGSSSSGGSSSEGGDEGLQKLGKGEGELNLISWAGYVEDEWVKPFEKES